MAKKQNNKQNTYEMLTKLRDELDALLAAVNGCDDVDSDTDEEEAPAKKPAKKSAAAEKPAKGGRGKKKPEPEPDEDDDDDEDTDEDADDDGDEMSIEEQVMAATEDMDDKEIAEFCADNGLSPKGKRAALIKRIVEAVENGDISLEDDGEDDADDDDEDEEPAPKKGSKKSDKAQKSSKSTKKSKKDEDEDEDDDSDDDDDGEEEQEPTKERLAALKKYDKQTRSEFKKGELERSDLVDFLCDFHNKKPKDYRNFSDAEVLDAYIEASSNLIDDDGEIIEQGAYTVNGVPFCCGRPLTYDEDSEQYVCEHCGGEYDADEE